MPQPPVYSIALTGTFDLANYGDLLFPLVLQAELSKRLGEVRVTLASPYGGPYLPDASRRVLRIPRVEDANFYSWAAEHDAIVVAGGDIIRFDDAALAGIYGISTDEAIASRAFRVLLLDLGELAAYVPVFWNGVGVPHECSAAQGAQLRDAVRHVRYLSVRDEASRSKLMATGLGQDVHVVPDSAFALPRVFDAPHLELRIAALTREGLFPASGRVLALHAGRLSSQDEIGLAAQITTLLAGEPQVSIVLVPITTCHGDLESHTRIAALTSSRVTLIPRALHVEDVAAIIAHADGFVGASLHGNITAFAYGRRQRFLSLSGSPASKVSAYARMLGRDDRLIDRANAFVPCVRELMNGGPPADPSLRRSIDESLTAHFDRLAQHLSGARGLAAKDELVIADRMHRDSIAQLRSTATVAAAGPTSVAPRIAAGRAPTPPSVSAVIPVFNGKRYLADAVASVAAQTVLPRELIVVDDGSSDDSMSVIDQRSLPFPIRMVRQANAGQSSARNHGARLAEGEVIALLDQDDRWYPQHLERLLQPFASQPALGFAYGNLDEIDRDGQLVCLGRLDSAGSMHPKFSLADLLSADLFIVPSATVIRRDALQAVGGFDEQFSGYEDDDLFIRLFRAGYAHVYVDESVSQWRIYRGSSSHTERMGISRRRFAEKLMELCPNDPELDQWWVRDLIAPRFFRKALHQYHLAMLKADWQGCRESQQEARYFGDRMIRGPRTRMRLALMQTPRMYRLLYRWWRHDPGLRSAARNDSKMPTRS